MSQATQPESGRTIVVALGGNALNRRGEDISAVNLRRNVQDSIAPLGKLAQQHRMILTHGNGPQVGLLALQNLAYEEVAAYPLDILGAETQGMLGYVVGQELMNSLKLTREMATILTTTEVDENDPSFANPTKFVGPVYDQARAAELAAQYGWTVKQDGEAWRRVVPSPQPKRIRQADTIRALADMGLIVLCVGGGGVPVIADYEAGNMHGVEAVIDKDHASGVLARDVRADTLLLLTDANAVYLDWGTPTQRAIQQATPAQLDEYGFAAGSMGPKVAAACDFVRSTEKEAIIGSLREVEAILRGEAGTKIVPDTTLMFYS